MWLKTNKQFILKV